ncbi:sigma-70 family RNA polymerase sigma factor [Actinoplanes sp. NPDC051470]|uniref:sigma-70 family RNA polymerase sigma factor n=1 Tax=unclassified Actinoplanes TaxID=2626549 RepID=UPI003423D65D
MTVAAAPAPSTVDAAEQPAKTDRAGELIAALGALPAGHPSRAAVRDRAIEAWMPMARHLANRYAGRGEPNDDLFQVALVGLIKAVDRYQADRGVEFAGFAIPTIVGELKRHFRDRTWSIRVPRRLQELRLAITAANATLTNTLGRSPTVADIAVHLEVRAAQSAWGFVDPAATTRAVGHLRDDLTSGAWDDKYGSLRTQPEFIGALRLIVGRP